MIAPLVPGADGLCDLLAGKVDHVLIDRMNYDYGAWVYRRHGLRDKLGRDFFRHGISNV